MSASVSNAPGRRPTPPPRAVKKQVPQKTIDEFWKAFTTKFPGKVHTIIPKNAYAKSKAAHEPKGTVFGQTTLKSYDEARDECVATVEKIAKECRRVNMRYRDPHFDIEFDLKSGKRDCLYGLLPSDDAGQPKSVKRVHVRCPTLVCVGYLHERRVLTRVRRNSKSSRTPCFTSTTLLPTTCARAARATAGSWRRWVLSATRKA